VHRNLDVEDQIRVAIDGFSDKKFFVMINSKEISNLDAVIDVDATTDIVFSKMGTLIGG